MLQKRLYGTVGLALLVGLYLLVGLTGHDPWRGDDARYFGPIYSMIEGDGLLFPTLAGQPLPTFPPLYYWVASLLALGSQLILPLHDGARLASAFFIALAIFFIVRAAEHLYGKSARAPAALLTLGTLGLVVHAHETQPMIALLAMQALTLAGLARTLHSPLKGALQAGVGTALSFLAGGLTGTLITLPLFLLVMVCPGTRTPHGSSSLLAGLCLAVGLSALWPLALHLTTPELLTLWLDNEWRSLTGETNLATTLPRLTSLLAWFIWPLWPIAAWGLWRNRRALLTLPWLLPLSATLLVLLWLILTNNASPSTALPLIPPLALLAAGGITSLRRGAANAFDWFALMSFAVFASLVWLAWTAQAFAWPPGLARHLARTLPDFTLPNGTWQASLGLIITLLWLILAWHLPRRTLHRGPANWAMGMTMLWCLAVILLMPWFNYGRSYRTMSHSLAQALQTETDTNSCIATTGLPDGIRSSLHYFNQIRTDTVEDGRTHCNLLLIYDDYRAKAQTPAPEWELIWFFQRGGGKQHEMLRLYRQNTLSLAQFTPSS